MSSSSLGGATVTAPATWLNRDLPVYFTRNASDPPRTPTRVIPTSMPSSTSTSTSTASPTSSSSSPILSTGAIAGIAIGGAAVIVLIALGCILCLRGRRRQSPSLPPVVYSGNVSTAPYSPTQYPAMPYSPPYPQQSSPLPELPENSRVPMYDVEPKYDLALTQAHRNASTPEQNLQAMEGVWAQRRASPHSPHPSQDYHPVPTQSPPPSDLITPVRSEPAELSASKPTQSAYSSPASYKARRPVTPGSERHYQYPEYS
jgi:hypothetical protein